MLNDISKYLKHKFSKEITQLQDDSLFESQGIATIRSLTAYLKLQKKQSLQEQLLRNFKEIELKISKCEQLLGLKIIKQRPSQDHPHYNFWLDLQSFVFRHFQRIVKIHLYSSNISLLIQAKHSLGELNQRIKEQGKKAITLFRQLSTESNPSMALQRLLVQQKTLIVSIGQTIKQEISRIMQAYQCCCDIQRLDLLIRRIKFRLQSDTLVRQEIIDRLE